MKIQVLIGMIKKTTNSKIKIKARSDGKRKKNVLNAIWSVDMQRDLWTAGHTDSLMLFWQCVYRSCGFRTLPFTGSASQSDVVFCSGCQVFQSVVGPRSSDLMALCWNNTWKNENFQDARLFILLLDVSLVLSVSVLAEILPTFRLLLRMNLPYAEVVVCEKALQLLQGNGLPRQVDRSVRFTENTQVNWFTDWDWWN